MALDSLVVLSVVFGSASMVAYGIIDYVSSIVAKRDNLIRITFWYFLLSSALLAVMGLLFRLPQISLLDALAFMVLPVISVLALLAFYKGMRIGKVSVVASIAGSWSVITVFVGVLFLNEAITLFLGIGIVLTILGAVLTSFKFKDLVNLKFDRFVPGVKYSVAAMLGWGVLYAAIGVISKQLGWFWPIFIISVGSTIVIFIYASISRIKTAFPTKLASLMFWYIVIGTAADLFYSLGTSKGYVSLVGPISAAAPFVAVILARVLAKEKVDTNQVIGIVCIILGLVIIAY